MTNEEQFNVFWDVYPNKKGKGHARKAFNKALKLTNLETILDALDLYKAHKPDWQKYCHPSTWLNQERWDDEWGTEPPTALEAFSKTIDALERLNEHGKSTTH